MEGYVKATVRREITELLGPQRRVWDLTVEEFADLLAEAVAVGLAASRVAATGEVVTRGRAVPEEPSRQRSAG